MNRVLLLSLLLFVPDVYAETPAEARIVWSGRASLDTPPLQLFRGADEQESTWLRAGDDTISLEGWTPDRFTPATCVDAANDWVLIGPGHRGEDVPTAVVADGDTIRAVDLPAASASPFLPTPTCGALAALDDGSLVEISRDGALTVLARELLPALDVAELDRGLAVARTGEWTFIGGPWRDMVAVGPEGIRRWSTDMAVRWPMVVAEEGRVLGLSTRGHLWSFDAIADRANVLVEAPSASHTGLTAIEGGVAWGDELGSVWRFDGVALTELARLDTAVRWPVLYTDALDAGRPSVVAFGADDRVLILDASTPNASATVLALGRRPAGAPGLYLADATQAPRIHVPTGFDNASHIALPAPLSQPLDLPGTTPWPGQSLSDTGQSLPFGSTREPIEDLPADPPSTSPGDAADDAGQGADAGVGDAEGSRNDTAEPESRGQAGADGASADLNSAPEAENNGRSRRNNGVERGCTAAPGSGAPGLGLFFLLFVSLMSRAAQRVVAGRALPSTRLARA